MDPSPQKATQSWKGAVFEPLIDGAKTEVKRRAVVMMRDALARATMKAITGV